MNGIMARAHAWLEEDPDSTTADELRGLLHAAQRGEPAAQRELTERFATQLEFGTAGLRGILGAGPNRMNRVLVRKVTAGLGAYLRATLPDAHTRGVVIGYDGRRNSMVFAEDTARVLAGLGIKTYLAYRPWPTPVCGWHVTHYGAAAGVMVTASHNPPEYNGYKVYWGNGAQIIPPHDQRIAAEIAKVGDNRSLAMPALEAAKAAKLVVMLDETTHDAYLAAVRTLLAEGPRGELRIAYTPLHGVGAASVEAALAQAGFTEVYTEPTQREPDGEFPTVAFPNPEEPGAMDRVLALARAKRADLVLANDPDADRLCVAVPEGDSYRVLSGDQVGALLADYLLATNTATKRMVATTIVSSQLLQFLATSYHADYRETLTGFKWIGDAALRYEASTGGEFIMGYEEALGYSVGPLVRDKDGVSAAVCLAQLSVWNRAQGRTLLAHLHDIYQRVGLFITAQVSTTLPGSEGLAKIAGMMSATRTNPPSRFGAYAIERMEDLAPGTPELPASNVLIFRIAGGHRIIMRPSGTEPKLKSYYEIRVMVQPGESIAAATARGQTELTALRTAHQATLVS